MNAEPKLLPEYEIEVCKTSGLRLEYDDGRPGYPVGEGECEHGCRWDGDRCREDTIWIRVAPLD